LQSTPIINLVSLIFLQYGKFSLKVSFLWISTLRSSLGFPSGSLESMEWDVRLMLWPLRPSVKFAMSDRIIFFCRLINVRSMTSACNIFLLALLRFWCSTFWVVESLVCYRFAHYKLSSSWLGYCRTKVGDLSNPYFGSSSFVIFYCIIVKRQMPPPPPPHTHTYIR
jgi:hypothetical protein